MGVVDPWSRATAAAATAAILYCGQSNAAPGAVGWKAPLPKADHGYMLVSWSADG